MALVIQLILGNASALNEPAMDGLSPFFRSGSWVIRNGVSGTQNTSVTCTFASSFPTSAPRIAFALKQYEGISHCYLRSKQYQKIIVQNSFFLISNYRIRFSIGSRIRYRDSRLIGSLPCCGSSVPKAFKCVQRHFCKLLNCPIFSDNWLWNKNIYEYNNVCNSRIRTYFHCLQLKHGSE
jgi:hypothetical protein